MRRLVPLLAIGVSTVAYVSCRTPASTNLKADEEPRPEEAPGGAGGRFDNRSATGGLMGSADGGKTFHIKGDYPATPDFLTKAPPEPDMAKIRRGPKDAEAVRAAKLWIDQIAAYIYEDMNESEFKTAPTPQSPRDRRPSNARWYHMPWLHTANATAAKPGRGREGFWGMTREMDFKGPVIKWPKVAGKTAIATDWGIGFYNEPGGFAIGQVFPPGNEAHPEFRSANGHMFPKGTVSFKILFTTAENIPSPAGENLIEGAFAVTANINGGGSVQNSNKARSPTAVRHVQMDVDMRFGDGKDDWIFGTWVYDKNARNDPKVWQGMRPLGVQWGPRLEETIVFSSDFEANGFKGLNETASRLNGPADNPQGSCLSCHARAQWPEPPSSRVPFAPKDANDTKVACLLHDWKGEEACGIPCDGGGCIPGGGQPLIPGSGSLDYSLQMALALRNRQITLGGEE